MKIMSWTSNYAMKQGKYWAYPKTKHKQNIKMFMLMPRWRNTNVMD